MSHAPSSVPPLPDEPLDDRQLRTLGAAGRSRTMPAAWYTDVARLAARNPDAAELAAMAFRLMRWGKASDSLLVFDTLVAHPEPDLRGLANALWTVSHDNTGLGHQPERARRYLARAESFGAENPTIFYNGACLWMEMGESDQAMEWIGRAVAAGHEDPRRILLEPMFAPLRDRDSYQEIAASCSRPDPVHAPHLLALARDLALDDHELHARLDQALAWPPMTTESVGFYGASSNPPEENCVRYLVSQLGERGHLLSGEDKYIRDTFAAFADYVQVPRSVHALFPRAYGGSGRALPRRKFVAAFPAAMVDLEAAFRAEGKVLLSVWMVQGDTLFWLVTTPEIAQRWAGRVLARTRDGEPLGLCLPVWRRAFWDVAYAKGWENDEAPALLRGPVFDAD